MHLQWLILALFPHVWLHVKYILYLLGQMYLSVTSIKLSFLIPYAKSKETTLQEKARLKEKEKVKEKEKLKEKETVNEKDKVKGKDKAREGKS